MATFLAAVYSVHWYSLLISRPIGVTAPEIILLHRHLKAFVFWTLARGPPLAWPV